MNVSRHQVSLGALALILCLALPMGVLSLFAPSTTGDQVDAADTILVARVSSMQVVRGSDSTVIGLQVQKLLVGERTAPVLQLSVRGLPSVDVGDLVVAMVRFEPDELLGVYQLQKDRFTLQYDVISPISGMFAQGISDVPPVPYALLEAAIQVRRGLASADSQDAVRGGVQAEPIVDPDAAEELEAALADDVYEPNNDIGSATPIFLDPPMVLTGNPTRITGLTLTEGDVDFFGFDGPGLTILHAQTRLPAGVTSFDLDTLVGLFDASNADLLAVDDDSGQGKLSRLVVPLEFTGQYALGVESAPDSDLDFSGDEGQTTGAYEFDVELEKAAYLSNGDDIIVGVSTDGTFIEDFIGFKEVGRPDVLLVGVPADGWGLSYTVDDPKLITGIFGGAGDQLSDPGFNTELVQLDFELGPFVDSNGFNRSGFANATTMLPHSRTPMEGLVLRTQYQISKNQTSVDGFVIVQFASEASITDVVYERVLDVDLFGTGEDTFYYSYDPTDFVKTFPVDTAGVVGDLTEPAASQGVVTGDLQMALTATLGNTSGLGPGDVRAFPMGFTLVSDFVSESDAVSAAVANLTAKGLDAWIVATDADPATGLYTAFGAGLSVRR